MRVTSAFIRTGSVVEAQNVSEDNTDFKFTEVEISTVFDGTGRFCNRLSEVLRCMAWGGGKFNRVRHGIQDRQFVPAGGQAAQYIEAILQRCGLHKWRMNLPNGLDFGLRTQGQFGPRQPHQALAEAVELEPVPMRRPGR